MKQDAYERTLKARAFDISRYLLPLATNTSLGEIVNARTLETQVSHLLSHTHAEIGISGELLKQARESAAYNVNHEVYAGSLVDEISELSPELGGDAPKRSCCKRCASRPTLVKYADPSAYEIETRRELRQIASELMKSAAIETARQVELLDDEPLEIELAARCYTSTATIPTGRSAGS